MKARHAFGVLALPFVVTSAISLSRRSLDEPRCVAADGLATAALPSTPHSLPVCRPRGILQAGMPLRKDP